MNQNNNAELSSLLVASRFYGCFGCTNLVAIEDDIVSKNFVAGRAKPNRAFLFGHVKNVVEGPARDRRLITGIYNVSDVHCSECEAYLGWKYIKVYNPTFLYKLGKTVLVKSKIIKFN